MPLAQSYEQAKSQVEQLVERFHRNLDAYKRQDYKEAQVRVEFVDPFFEALGWDVRNTKGYAEQYKDMVHEDALRVGRAVHAPDYCFRIGGTRKFFLEARKPSVSVRGDVRAGRGRQVGCHRRNAGSRQCDHHGCLCQDRRQDRRESSTVP
jgi:hypothetical protein